MAERRGPTQIENRNFLAPTGFKFQLNRTPKVTYFGNAVNIPAIDLGVAEQPTYLRDIPLPGDKLQFADFSLRFLVDEGLENYMEIQNWMRGLGFPESLKEIYDFQKGNPDISQPPKSQLKISFPHPIAQCSCKESHAYVVKNPMVCLFGLPAQSL